MPFYRVIPKVVNALFYDGKNQKEISEFCGAQYADEFGGYLSLTMSDLVNINIFNDSYIVKHSAGGFAVYGKDEFEMIYEKI